MHLDDERIQRALHGELDAGVSEAAERHLAECASCKRRLEEAEHEEQWVFGLLRQADRAAPVIDAEAVAVRAGRAERGRGWEPGAEPESPAGSLPPPRSGWKGDPARGSERESDVRRRWGRSWAGDPRLRWAAGIVLILTAAGVAYTAPGSPVPAWIDRVLERIASKTPGAPSEEPGAVPHRAPATAGIAVAPHERFTIRFAAPQAKGVVLVSLNDGPEIVARASGGAVTFSTEADRLTIANAGATADYEIELPHSAAWVEILVGERPLLVKEADRLLTEAAADGQGRYVLTLAPPVR